MAHFSTVLSSRFSRARMLLGAALLGVAFIAAFAASGATANASSSLHYQRGYYLSNGWFCYGWSSGAYHCTAHWHRSGNRVISDNPSWVPNYGTARVATASRSSSGKSATTTYRSVSGSNTAGQPCHSSVMFPAHISSWTTPVSCYAGVYRVNPANYVYRSGFGWCNWWPEVLHPRQPDILWGREYRHSSTPTPGAVVRFAPGVQGASSAGHYAQVVGVAPDHYWVLITEMNFSWRGAGWQKVSYRYIHVGPGVTFIS
ncbi:MAG: hypothetical protein ACM3N4_02055 [Nitrososphaerota archaeon]